MIEVFFVLELHEGDGVLGGILASLDAHLLHVPVN